MAERQDNVSAVGRALSLLDCFLDSRKGVMTLTELAETSGLYKSTCLRLLQTLQAYQFLERLDDGQYRIDYKALRLASLYQETVQPHEIIIPALRKLVAETGESASYNVLRSGHRVCIYRIESPHRIRDHIKAGDISPPNRGAVGAVLQAFTEKENPRFEYIRKSMIASSIGSVDPDTAGMAAPIFGEHNELIAALALSGPISRFGVEKLIKFSRELLSCASELTEKMKGDAEALNIALSNLKYEQSGKPENIVLKQHK